MKSVTVSNKLQRALGLATPALVAEAAEEIETPFGTYLRGVFTCDLSPSSHCHSCGREIAHPVGTLLGYGPECAQKLDIPRDYTAEEVERIRDRLRKRHRRELALPTAAIRPGQASVAHLEKEADSLTLHFEYNAALSERLRGLPKARWNPERKAWSLPYEPAVARALAKLLHQEGFAVAMPPALFMELLEAEDREPPRPTRKATLRELEGKVGLQTPYDEEVVLLARSLGGRWDRERHLWLISGNQAGLLRAALQELGWAVEGPDYQGCDPEHLQALLKAVREGRELECATLTAKPAQLVVEAPYRFREALERVGGYYDRSLKARVYPTPSRAQVTAIEEVLKDTMLRRYGDWKALEEEWAWEEEARQIARATELPEPPHLKTTPWLHQKRGYHFLTRLYQRNRPGGMLAFDMGTGKTLTAIAFAGAHFRRVLVGAPKSVVSSWAREFAMHSSLDWVCAALQGSVPDKLAQAQAAMREAEEEGKPLVIAVNYESLVREPLAGWAMGQPWDLLVLDESHKLKAPDGQRAKFMAELSQKIRFRVGLTGTPMPHSPLDVWAQMRIIDPHLFGTNYWNFRDRYAVLDSFGGVRDYINQEELHQRFYTRALRVSKAEAVELPPEQHQQILVDLGPQALQHYQELMRWLETEVAEERVTAANALVQLLRIQQITSGFLPGENGLVRVDRAKEEALEDLLEGLTGEPVVVFCRFQPDLEVVHEVCQRLGRSSGELSGRKDQWEAFQFKGAFEVLAAQIQAGGVGVNLSRAAYAIYYSVGFSLGDYLQSLARVHRPGQRRPVTYYHLVARNTIDERVYEALEARQDLVEAILAKKPQPA